MRIGKHPMRLALFLLLLLLLAAPLVSAANPHFIKNKSKAYIDDMGGLVVDFKEAGLGEGVTVTIEVSAHVEVLWGCINNGGNHPKAANKEYAVADLSQSGQFTADKNGNVVGALTIPYSELPTPVDWDCPPGQDARILKITYSNIQLCDLDNNVCLSLKSVSKTLWP